jgi:hypothetical protein
MDNKLSKQQSTTYIPNSHAGPHATVQVGHVVQHVGGKSKVVLLFDLLLVDGSSKIAALALLFHEGLMSHKILFLL